MNGVKGAIAVLLPAGIVVARLVMEVESSHGLVLPLAFLASAGSVIGCLIAVLCLRGRFVRLPADVIVASSVGVAVGLLAIFPMMAQWPFAVMGLVGAWVLFSAGLMALFIYVASHWYA